MNDVSKAIVSMVHRLNGGDVPKFAYTFDAGPNAVLFCLKKDVQNLINAVVSEFGPIADPSRDENFVRGITERTFASCASPSGTYRGEVSYLFHTNVGRGAEPIDDGRQALADLDIATGMPL